MNVVKNISVCATLFFSLSVAAEPSVEGYWRSVDDKTGEDTAVWKLVVEDKKLYGYLVSYPDMKADDVCIECKGDLKDFANKPIKSTAWMTFSKNRKGVWQDGYIIDPGEGKKYKAKLWIEEGKLRMRGYIGFLYRTQTWLPAQYAATIKSS